MPVIRLHQERVNKTCNGCVSLYHLGNKNFRCGIFKKEQMVGYVNPKKPEEGVKVFQPKPCPFYSTGGNNYHD